MHMQCYDIFANVLIELYYITSKIEKNIVIYNLFKTLLQQ